MFTEAKSFSKACKRDRGHGWSVTPSAPSLQLQEEKSKRCESSAMEEKQEDETRREEKEKKEEVVCGVELQGATHLSGRESCGIKDVKVSEGRACEI